MIKQSVTYLFGRGIPGILNFLFIIILTRLLAPQEYGEYTLVLSSVGMINSILFWWLRFGLLRFFPNEPNKEMFLSNILTIYLISMTFVSLVVISTVLIMDIESILIISGLLLLWIQVWFELNLELLRTKLLALQHSIVALLKAIFTIGISSFFAYLGFGSEGVIIGVAIGTLISTISVTKNQWSSIKSLNFNSVIIYKLLRYGLPLTLTFSLAEIISNIDRFMITSLIDIEHAGYYAASFDLTQRTLGLLMIIINLAAFPLAINALENKGIEVAREQLNKNISLLLSISIPAAVAMIVLSEDISKILFEGMFERTAVNLIPIVSLVALFSGLKNFYFDQSFQLGEKTYLQFIPVLFAVILNVPLNYILIPTMGLMGAAYSSLISYFVALLISVFIGRYTFPMPFPKVEILKILMSTLGLGISVYILNTYTELNVAIKSTIGLFVYFCILIILKARIIFEFKDEYLNRKGKK